MLRYCLAFTLILVVLQAGAQVNEIKQASSENSKRSGGGKSDSDDGGGGFFMVDLFFNAIPSWQAFKLQSDRERYPAMVSLDVMLQAGSKPSSYYMLWPRVRGNWGLFSTDFRMNYLIEEGADGEWIHIRTNDWQILQINLITSRFFTFRLGSGFMHEAFGAKRSFNESAFLFNIHAPDQTKNLGFEYRFAKDWDTGANPRREFNVTFQQQLFSAGALHTYIVVGGVYQRYYNAIEIWGFTGGVVFRLF